MGDGEWVGNGKIGLINIHLNVSSFQIAEIGVWGLSLRCWRFWGVFLHFSCQVEVFL